MTPYECLNSAAIQYDFRDSENCEPIYECISDSETLDVLTVVETAMGLYCPDKQKTFDQRQEICDKTAIKHGHPYFQEMIYMFDGDYDELIKIFEEILETYKNS